MRNIMYNDIFNSLLGDVLMIGGMLADGKTFVNTVKTKREANNIPNNVILDIAHYNESCKQMVAGLCCD